MASSPPKQQERLLSRDAELEPLGCRTPGTAEKKGWSSRATLSAPNWHLKHRGPHSHPFQESKRLKPKGSQMWQLREVPQENRAPPTCRLRLDPPSSNSRTQSFPSPSLGNSLISTADTQGSPGSEQSLWPKGGQNGAQKRENATPTTRITTVRQVREDTVPQKQTQNAIKKKKKEASREREQKCAL